MNKSLLPLVLSLACASALAQTSNSQSSNSQSWSAEQIRDLTQSYTPQTGQQGMQRFTQQFDQHLLGYTSDDASMETYYIDEEEQVVALYSDNANPNDVLLQLQEVAIQTPASNEWDSTIIPQTTQYDPWVGYKVADTAAQLQQQLQSARLDGKPYLLWVNVPSFTLRVFDTQSGQQVLRSRVIVGASGTQTPIFSTDVTNLKFNPDWSPPPSLKRKGKVYTPPSDNNPLGQVRFSTNNAANIYLHDTNNHDLFERDIRALSAGCVRVESWHELAQILAGMSPEEVDQATQGHRTHYKDVPDSRVWISYERIDLDETGQLALYGDIYRKQNLPQNNLPRAIE